jgi:hypothetical protein
MPRPHEKDENMNNELRMIELLEMIELHLDPRRERRFDYRPITADDARHLADIKPEMDLTEVKAKVYEYIRGAAKNGKLETTIDLPRNELSKKAMEDIRKDGFIVELNKQDDREYLISWSSVENAERVLRASEL